MTVNIRTPWALGLAVAAVGLALSGCGGPGTSGSGATAAPPAVEQPPSASAAATATIPATAGPGSSSAAPSDEILIKGFKYLGADTVSPGAMITVTNDDIEAHTITADAGSAFDASIKVGTGTFTAPAEPGTYPYHCTFHGNMRGTLTVK